MKRLARTLGSLCPLGLMLLAATFSALPAPAQEWEQLQKNIPKLPPFHPQEPKRIVFPNGMVVFLQEDHELPLIDATAHPDRVLLQRPQTRQRLAGIADLRLGAAHRFDPGRGRGGYSG